jgi:hypothetical protein
LTYLCAAQSGTFTDGEVLGDGTNTADQGTGYPTVTNHYTAYTSGGSAIRVARTLTGLTHLEGESLAVLGDGTAHPEETVASGSITLDRYYNKVHMGLGYTAQMKPMRIEGGAAKGTSQGMIKRIHRIVIRFFETLGCKVGPDSDNLEVVPFRAGSDPMDTGPPLFTGDKSVLFRGPYEREGDILIVQDQPLPMTICSIVSELVTYD